MALTLLNEKYYVDESFDIKRNKNLYEMKEATHTHDFIELIYVFKGTCVHYIDGKEYVTNPGNLLFVNYGSTHSFVTDKAMDYVNIIIKPDFVSNSLSGVENAFALLTLSDFCEFSKTVNRAKLHMNFCGDEQHRIETLIQIMENEKKHHSSGSDFILKSCLDTFLVMVFRKMSLPIGDRMYLSNDLLTYINDNCGENLSLKKISALCYYNPSYFSRAFKNYTGKTFVNYLTECRLNKACDMLENTDAKIDFIIEKCGFVNRTLFFKKFYEFKHVTPLQYRKSKK